MDKTARAHVKHAAETALRCLSQGVPVEALYGLLQLTRDYPGHVCVIKQSFLSCLAAFLDSINCGDSEADLQRFSRVARDVCEVYCHDDAALTMLGVKCLDEGLVRQAQFFLEAALRVDPDCLGAKENLRALYDRMVVRWHFLMLNDFSRNMAYATAIERAVASRPDCYVLDIGSGTGILSMMAAKAGAKLVSACDFSETLFSLSRDIIAANGLEDQVSVMHALSTSLTVQRDIPSRVDLVVTEIVDAGLLGEYIVPTLRHAWKELLLPRIPQSFATTAAMSDRGGRVIPRGATVYAVALECAEIRGQSRLLSNHICGLDMSCVELEGSNKTGEANGTTTTTFLPLGTLHQGMAPLVHEPYTCERLAQIRGGYATLTSVCKVLEFDFLDPEIPLPESNLTLAVTSSGQVDAIATWFDLHLDEDISISTSPLWDISWEQALFPVQRGVVVAPGDFVHLHSSCSDILLDVKLVGVSGGAQTPPPTPPQLVPSAFLATNVVGQTHRVSETSVLTQAGSLLLPPPPLMTQLLCPHQARLFYVERHELSRLNDQLYMETYFQALRRAIVAGRDPRSEEEGEEEMEGGVCEDMRGLCLEGGGGARGGGVCGDARDDGGGVVDCIVLDLTHGPSLFGIAAAKEGADFVQIGRSQHIYRSLLSHVAEANGVMDSVAISRLELSSLTPSHPVWDIVVSDVVSPQGTLHPGILDELAYLRSQFFHSGTEVLPSKLTVHAVCISSPTLKAQSCVLGTIPTLGFDIASFINRYQVSHFIDVDLSTLPYDELSDTFKLLSVNLATLSTKPLQAEVTMYVTVTTPGAITGIAYWFELAMQGNLSISTGPSAYKGSHWHQAVFLLNEDLAVHRGDQLIVRGVVRDSCLDISLRQTSTT